MSLVKTNIPGLKIREVIDESRRIQKHQDRNFALLNDSMALVTFTGQHAVEVPILNPFRDRGAPVGFRPLDSSGLGVSSHTMRVARLTEDNRIGMTVQFQPTLVGEMVGPITRLRSSGLALTTGTAANIATTTSITLTAGMYDVRGAIGFLPDPTTSITLLVGAVSKTSATLPAAASVCAVPVDGEIWTQFSTPAAVPGNNALTLTIPTYRVTVATGATTTLYLVGRATFTVAALTGFGWLEATKVAPQSGYSATVTGILYGPNSNITDVNG